MTSLLDVIEAHEQAVREAEARREARLREIEAAQARKDTRRLHEATAAMRQATTDALRLEVAR